MGMMVLLSHPAIVSTILKDIIFKILCSAGSLFENSCVEYDCVKACHISYGMTRFVWTEEGFEFLVLIDAASV